MLETEIINIRGREIMDSRGNPTVECDVELAGGAIGQPVPFLAADLDKQGKDLLAGGFLLFHAAAIAPEQGDGQSNSAGSASRLSRKRKACGISPLRIMAGLIRLSEG